MYKYCLLHREFLHRIDVLNGKLTSVHWIKEKTEKVILNLLVSANYRRRSSGLVRSSLPVKQQESSSVSLLSLNPLPPFFSLSLRIRIWKPSIRGNLKLSKIPLYRLPLLIQLYSSSSNSKYKRINNIDVKFFF